MVHKQGLKLKLLFTGQHEHLLEYNKFDYLVADYSGLEEIRKQLQQQTSSTIFRLAQMMFKLKNGQY